MPPRVETLYKKTDAGLIGKPPSTRFYGQVQLPPSPASPLRLTIVPSKSCSLNRLINDCETGLGKGQRANATYYRGVAQVGQSCGLLIREPWVRIPSPRQSVRSAPITIGRSLACVEAFLANKGRKVRILGATFR